MARPRVVILPPGDVPAGLEQRFRLACRDREYLLFRWADRLLGRPDAWEIHQMTQEIVGRFRREEGDGGEDLGPRCGEGGGVPESQGQLDIRGHDGWAGVDPLGASAELAVHAGEAVRVG